MGTICEYPPPTAPPVENEGEMGIISVIPLLVPKSQNTETENTYTKKNRMYGHPNLLHYTDQRKANTMIIKPSICHIVDEKVNYWPLMLNVGPAVGCRTQAMLLMFSCAPSAWTSPRVVVVFPSPNGVGVILQRTENNQNKKQQNNTLWSPNCNHFLSADLAFFYILHSSFIVNPIINRNGMCM